MFQRVLLNAFFRTILVRHCRYASHFKACHSPSYHFKATGEISFPIIISAPSPLTLSLFDTRILTMTGIKNNTLKSEITKLETGDPFFSAFSYHEYIKTVIDHIWVIKKAALLQVRDMTLFHALTDNCYHNIYKTSNKAVPKQLASKIINVLQHDHLSDWFTRGPFLISQTPRVTADTSQTPHLQFPKRPPELTFIPLTTLFISLYSTRAFALNTTEYGIAQSALKLTPLTAWNEKAVGKAVLRGKQ